MAVTPKKLGVNTLGTGATTMVAAVPASTQYMVKSIRVVNKNTVAVTLNAVTIGGIQIIPAESIPAGGTFQDDSLFIMEAGDTMVSSASTAASLDYFISGSVVN